MAENELHHLVLSGDLAALEAHLTVHSLSVNTSFAGASILHHAIRAKHLPVVQFLLSRGADINIRSGDGYTPLHYSAICGNTAVGGALLDEGADTTALTPENWNIFCLALEHQNYLFIDLLTLKGYSIDTRDANGNTLLHFACLSGNIAGLSWLISSGADLSATNNDGRLVVHMAAFIKNMEIARHLMRENCSRFLRVKDNRGLTACDIAKRNRLHNMLHMFELQMKADANRLTYAHLRNMLLEQSSTRKATFSFGQVLVALVCTVVSFHALFVFEFNADQPFSLTRSIMWFVLCYTCYLWHYLCGSDPGVIGIPRSCPTPLSWNSQPTNMADLFDPDEFNSYDEGVEILSRHTQQIHQTEQSILGINANDRKHTSRSLTRNIHTDFPFLTESSDYCKHLVEGQSRLCSVCRILMPYRSAHCTTCHRCIVGFDRHSWIVNNCIGYRNYRTYNLMLLAFSMLCMLYMQANFPLLHKLTSVHYFIGFVICSVMFVCFLMSLIALGYAFFTISKGAYCHEYVNRLQPDYSYVMNDNYFESPYDQGVLKNVLNLVHRDTNVKPADIDPSQAKERTFVGI